MLGTHRLVTAAATALAFAALAAACVTGDRVRQSMRIGMTRDEVIKKLGTPDGVRAIDDYESLTYCNRLISGWSWDRADYLVVLRGGKVVEYGPGEVRQDTTHGVQTLVIVPLR